VVDFHQVDAITRLMLAGVGFVAWDDAVSPQPKPLLVHFDVNLFLFDAGQIDADENTGRPSRTD